MSARENGWHIKAEGYMTSEPSFQKIIPKKACDAIELRRVLTFIRFENGIVADHRTYVPREFLANEHTKNRKLREEADQLRSYEAGYIAMRAVRDKLKAENAKLRNENVILFKKVQDLENDAWAEGFRDGCETVDTVTEEWHKAYMDDIAELREQVKIIHSAYIGAIEKYEQSEEAIMDDYSGTTSYDDGMQRIKQECNELRHRFDDTMVALGIEVE